MFLNNPAKISTLCVTFYLPRADVSRLVEGLMLMTKMLASVQNRQEAEIVFHNGADIIDLKDPSNGALGAVETQKLLEVIDFISGRRPIECRMRRSSHGTRNHSPQG